MKGMRPRSTGPARYCACGMELDQLASTKTHPGITF
jgi:hypothetical protein